MGAFQSKKVLKAHKETNNFLCKSYIKVGNYVYNYMQIEHLVNLITQSNQNKERAAERNMNIEF